MVSLVLEDDNGHFAVLQKVAPVASLQVNRVTLYRGWQKAPNLK
jgi:hypothetical protein